MVIELQPWPKLFGSFTNPRVKINMTCKQNCTVMYFNTQDNMAFGAGGGGGGGGFKTVGLKLSGSAPKTTGQDCRSFSCTIVVSSQVKICTLLG